MTIRSGHRVAGPVSRWPDPYERKDDRCGDPPVSGVVERAIRSQLASLMDGTDSQQVVERIQADGDLLRDAMGSGRHNTALFEAMGERVSTCYSIVQFMDLQYVKAIQQGDSVETITFWNDQCDRANARLSRSLGSFAMIYREIPRIFFN